MSLPVLRLTRAYCTSARIIPKGTAKGIADREQSTHAKCRADEQLARQDPEKSTKKNNSLSSEINARIGVCSPRISRVNGKDMFALRSITRGQWETESPPS